MTSALIKSASAAIEGLEWAYALERVNVNAQTMIKAVVSSFS